MRCSNCSPRQRFCRPSSTRSPLGSTSPNGVSCRESKGFDPRTLGDADPRRGRGLAGLRAGPVPRRLLQRPLAVCAGDGRDRRASTSATCSSRRGRARSARCPTCTRSTPNSTTSPRRPDGTRRADMTVLAIDQGTSGTKAIVVDEAGQVVGHRRGRRCARDYLPGGGVEQDPEALLASVLDAGTARPRRGRADPFGAVALANQGETVLAWDRRTGRAAHPGDRLAGPPRRVRLRGAGRITPTPSPRAPGWSWTRTSRRRRWRGCARNLDPRRRGHHHRHLADPPTPRCVRHRRRHRQPVTAARPGHHRLGTPSCSSSSGWAARTCPPSSAATTSSATTDVFGRRPSRSPG